MSFYSDLIEQAEHLALREPKKPRQASLRRAVSTAYYALFHMLISDGASKLTPNSPVFLRLQAQRAFTHNDMRRACEPFAKSQFGGGLSNLIVTPLEEELNRLAATFIDLQQARHSADYDMSETFDRVRVLQTIDQAKRAISDWKAVRNRPNANVFLAALLLQNRWNR